MTPLLDFHIGRTTTYTKWGKNPCRGGKWGCIVGNVVLACGKIWDLATELLSRGIVEEGKHIHTIVQDVLNEL